MAAQAVTRCLDERGSFTASCSGCLICITLPNPSILYGYAAYQYSCLVRGMSDSLWCSPFGLTFHDSGQIQGIYSTKGRLSGPPSFMAYSLCSLDFCLPVATDFNRQSFMRCLLARDHRVQRSRWCHRLMTPNRQSCLRLGMLPSGLWLHKGFGDQGFLSNLGVLNTA
jgi:hypothetical protein